MRYFSFFIILLCIPIGGCLNKMAKNADKESNYEGIISDIYVDIYNHSINIFSINTTNGKIKIAADSYPYCWKYASIGDSIIKPKGELYIIIKKKGAEPKLFYYE